MSDTTRSRLEDSTSHDVLEVLVSCVFMSIPEGKEGDENRVFGEKNKTKQTRNTHIPELEIEQIRFLLFLSSFGRKVRERETKISTEWGHEGTEPTRGSTRSITGILPLSSDKEHGLVVNDGLCDTRVHKFGCRLRGVQDQGST